MNAEAPAALNGRQADNWRPLIALANAIDRELATRVSTIAVEWEEHSAIDRDADNLKVTLLRDTREVFDRTGADFIPSSVLVGNLKQIEESPWDVDFDRGKGLSTHWLARLLRDFDVRPTKKRVDNGEHRGYSRSAFEDVWTRYLTPEGGNDQRKGPNESASKGEKVAEETSDRGHKTEETKHKLKRRGPQPPQKPRPRVWREGDVISSDEEKWWKS